ncbi:hypothetical protein [Polaribacter uvawellassae]|uniref:hypothetical protein n=1 Tax=Polaribacter uvawellassae TaxID=3133495 RepID=UPI00321BD5F0
MLITIIAAIIVTGAIAFLIVKFLPLKLRPIVSILLLVLAVFLTWKIYDGVMKPINFHKNKKVVYEKVINRLKMIRDGQVAHKEVTGKYSKSISGLIQFIDTAKLAITNTTTVVEKVNKGTKWQPIMVDVEKRVTDTIGYEPVISRFTNRDYKSMAKVPGTDKEFSLEIGMVDKFNVQVDVFFAKANKIDVLKGMDPSLVKQELEAITSDEIKGEFISVGSLNEVTTGGNWPPSYDKNDRETKDDK